MIDTSKVHKLRSGFEYLHVDPYHKKSCSTLVLSPSLEDEQRLSMGVLLTALKYHILGRQFLHKHRKDKHQH
jgi:hypothetical protein